jgi:hypothetical protein
MTFRLSEVPTALSTQEKSTLFAERRVHRILDIDCQEDGGWFIWQYLEAAARALGPKCLLKNSGPGKKDVPQGLKPNVFSILYGPTKVALIQSFGAATSYR